MFRVRPNKRNDLRSSISSENSGSFSVWLFFFFFWIFVHTITIFILCPDLFPEINTIPGKQFLKQPVPDIIIVQRR